MDAQIKEALTRAREVLRGLSFKDVAITSVLEAIARTLDTERAPNGQAPAQPAPAAQDDAKDAARWRYAVAIGENQAMNWLDVYNDWDGEGSFVDAIDAARAADKKEPS